MRASIAACNGRFVEMEHDNYSKACELRNAELPWFCSLQQTTDMRGRARRKVCSGPRLDLHEQGEVAAA